MERRHERQDWNIFVLNLWEYLGSESTCFIVQGDSESLEYRNRSLVYRDEWGSVPVEIFPEDISAMAAAARYSSEDAGVDMVRLEVFTLLLSDTLRTEVPFDSTVIASLFDRGRREIRRNQMVE